MMNAHNIDQFPTTETYFKPAKSLKHFMPLSM